MACRYTWCPLIATDSNDCDDTQVLTTAPPFRAGTRGASYPCLSDRQGCPHTPLDEDDPAPGERDERRRRLRISEPELRQASTARAADGARDRISAGARDRISDGARDRISAGRPPGASRACSTASAGQHARARPACGSRAEKACELGALAAGPSIRRKRISGAISGARAAGPSIWREWLWGIAHGPTEAAFACPTRAAIPSAGTAGPAAAASSTAQHNASSTCAAVVIALDAAQHNASSTNAAVVIALDAAVASGAPIPNGRSCASPSLARWAAHPRGGKWLRTSCELTSCESPDCPRPLRIGGRGRCRLVLGPNGD